MHMTRTCSDWGGYLTSDAFFKSMEVGLQKNEIALKKRKVNLFASVPTMVLMEQNDIQLEMESSIEANPP